MDRYGRTLAYVWNEGRLFNETLVAEGYAQVSTFPPNVKYVERFLAAQREARESNRGLWGACQTSNGDTGEDEGGGTAQGDCTPGYIPCLPPASDYDCLGGTGDGPEYVAGPVQLAVHPFDPRTTSALARQLPTIN